MAFRALTDIFLGNRPPVKAGEEIPEHWVDMAGEKLKVDFDRLVELGAAEEVKLTGRGKPKADSPAE